MRPIGAHAPAAAFFGKECCEVGIRRLRGSIGRATIVATVVLGLATAVAAANALHLRADLLGANENPDADPNGRGTAIVTIDLDTNEVCFVVSYTGVGTPNRAHIHVGAPETNGAIVVPFFDLHTEASRFDPRQDVLEQRSQFRDCVPGDPTVLANIAANPGGHYVNLHNARFPGGMIRGQLQVTGGGAGN